MNETISDVVGAPPAKLILDSEGSVDIAGIEVAIWTGLTISAMQASLLVSKSK